MDDVDAGAAEKEGDGRYLISVAPGSKEPDLQDRTSPFDSAQGDVAGCKAAKEPLAPQENSPKTGFALYII